MVHYFLWSLSLLAAMTSLTLPQAFRADVYLVPTYSDSNNLSFAVLPAVQFKTPPQKKDLNWGPAIQSRAAVIMDAATGMILWQKNPEAPLPIASITKLMTAVVAQDYITNWDETYTMQWSEVNLGGATFAGGVGDTFTKADLLKTALVASANSSAAALAHSTGLPEDQFVAAMNRKAQLLGMSQTQYVEPTGLSAANVSSVKDLAMLLRTITDYDRLLEPLTQVEHRMVKRDATTGEPLPDNQEVITKTTNRLVKEHDPLIVAGKTGFTYEAGHCLASVARSAAGHEVFVVVLGGVDETSRFTETHDLAQWAFDHYQWTE